MLRDCPDEVIDQVIASAIKVHREMGPGLLESVYEQALAIELVERGFSVSRQVEIPVRYCGKDLGIGFRADVVVDDCLLLELKSVDRLQDFHTAQIMTYLKFLKYKRGFIINFNQKLLKNGIKRISI